MKIAPMGVTTVSEPTTRPRVDDPFFDPRQDLPDPGYGSGGDEPPQDRFRGPLESVLRHPFLALLPPVLLVAAAIAVGLVREPVYTAEARVSVGRVDVPAYTLQGVTIGNATLAASYSRAIGAPEILQDAARAGGIGVADARDSITASQVPKSTIIRVEAEGGSREQAQRMANAAAQSLIAYVTDLTSDQQENSAVRRYRQAQSKADKARQRFQRVSRGRSENAPVVQEARLEMLTANLRAQSRRSRVVNGMIQGTVEAPPQNLLQLVVPATSASSDAASVLQRLGLIGLAVGIVLGIGLALLAANRALLRGQVD